jgi:hypothetical protein
MLRDRVDFVREERVDLFGKESRRRSLFTLLDRAPSRLENKHTSVIAGHGMPERSYGRAEPDSTSVVSEATSILGPDGECFVVRKERG